MFDEFDESYDRKVIYTKQSEDEDVSQKLKNLKLLFPSIFVGTSDTLSRKHSIFRSQITSAYTVHNQCTFLISLI